MALVVVATATAQPPQNKNLVKSEFVANIPAPEVKKVHNHFMAIKGVEGVDIDVKKDVVEIRYDKVRVSEGELLKNFEKMRIKAHVIKKK